MPGLAAGRIAAGLAARGRDEIATKVDGGLKPNPNSVLLEHFAQQR